MVGCQTLGQRTGWHVEQKLPYQVSGCVVASLQQPIDNVVSCRKKNYTNMMIFFFKLYCDSGGINPLVLEGVLCFEVTDLLIKILPHVSGFLSGTFTVGSAFFFFFFPIIKQ